MHSSCAQLGLVVGACPEMQPAFAKKGVAAVPQGLDMGFKPLSINALGWLSLGLVGDGYATLSPALN